MNYWYESLKFKSEDIQGNWTQFDTFQTNSFLWLNDILVKSQWFWGSWDRDIWFKMYPIFISSTSRPFHLCLLLLKWPQTIKPKTCWIYQICKDFDHENMEILKLNILYLISLSQDNEKLLFWHISIWVRWPCRYLAQACEMCESYGQTQSITVCSQIINAIKAKKRKISQQEKRQKNISKPYTLASLLFTTTYVSKWNQNLYGIANFIDNKIFSNLLNVHNICACRVDFFLSGMEKL